MIIDDNIKDEKLQYDLNSRIRALSSRKIDKYKYLAGEEIQIFLQEKFWKDNQKRLKIKEKNK